MRDLKRVVVTGMGAITPIGNSVEEFWSSVKEQKIGFAPITHFDASEYRAHLAAEVKDFDPKKYMDRKIYPENGIVLSVCGSCRKRGN